MPVTGRPGDNSDIIRAAVASNRKAAASLFPTTVASIMSKKRKPPTPLTINLLQSPSRSRPSLLPLPPELFPAPLLKRPPPPSLRGRHDVVSIRTRRPSRRHHFHSRYGARPRTTRSQPARQTAGPRPPRVRNGCPRASRAYASSRRRGRCARCQLQTRERARRHRMPVQHRAGA